MKSPRKQRILVLLPLFDLGGAEKQGLYAARSLQGTERYEVEVWALAMGTGKLLPFLDESGLAHKDTGIGFGVFQHRWQRIGAYLRFWRMLLAGRFDAIIPFTYHCNVISATLFRFAGVRRCLWFQIAMEFHIPLTFWERMAKALRPTYAANSLAAGSYIAHKHGIDAQRVAFIPNPFEPIAAKRSPEQWRQELGCTADDLLMVMAANYFPEKDHATLICAMPALLERHPTLKLVFAGSLQPAGWADGLKALCYDLGLHGRVLFIGSTDDIPGLLNTAHIGILSSRSEGSPNALIEYMGYGLPVIATRIPAITELLGEDYPYLFDVENVEGLTDRADRMIRALNGGLSDLIERNRKHVEQQYSVANNLAAFEKLLE